MKYFAFGSQPIVYVGIARLCLEQFVGTLPDSILQRGFLLRCLLNLFI